MPVVVGLARSVDPQYRVELHRRALGFLRHHVHRSRCRAVIERGNAGDAEDLRAFEAERFGSCAGLVLQRQHAHPNQVRTMDALVRLGDDSFTPSNAVPFAAQSRDEPEPYSLPDRMTSGMPAAW